MPRKCVFLYLCMCRYGYEKNEQKQSQNRQKRARDWKKVKSRSQGSKMIKESSKLHKKSSEIHQSANLVPDQSLKEMSYSVPALSDNYKNNPFEEKSKVILHNSENYNTSPWNISFEKFRTGPLSFRFYNLGPYLILPILIIKLLPDP
jgi:hypothetical protein